MLLIRHAMMPHAYYAQRLRFSEGERFSCRCRAISRAAPMITPPLSHLCCAMPRYDALSMPATPLLMMPRRERRCRATMIRQPPAIMIRDADYFSLTPMMRILRFTPFIRDTRCYYAIRCYDTLICAIAPRALLMSLVITPCLTAFTSPFHLIFVLSICHIYFISIEAALRLPLITPMLLSGAAMAYRFSL